MMSDQDQDDSDNHHHYHANHTKKPPEPTIESAGSPDGSQASQSSSTRRNAQRIVELLPELISRQAEAGSAGGPENWVIGAEFYHEDIGAEDERMSLEIDDEEDEEELEDQDVENEVDADGLDEIIEEDYDEEADDDDYDDDDMGFVLAPGGFEGSDSSSDEEGDGENRDNDSENGDHEPDDYDTTLPISHRYLGDNFEESRGTQVFAETSELSLPLFNLRHIVLLPGQVLPFKTTATDIYRNIHESLRDLITSGTTLIGLMSNPRENPTGTTAEIRSYCLEEFELTLKLEGRQRFRLLGQPFETSAVGSVKILPEVRLGRPYLLPPSRRKLLLNQSLPHERIVASRHPLWALKKYEAANIVKRILHHIRDWYPADLTTRDPNDLSYWVAANLPLSNKERMTLLGLDCTEQRLLWLLELLERSQYLSCAGCGNVISFKVDMFAMSCTGLQTSFVNEYGYVHDTLTVRSAQCLIRDVDSRTGRLRWSTACCWFPGYKWNTTRCDTCSRHIGWCYKSLTRDTRPRIFWGLSRASVKLVAAAARRRPSGMDE